MNLTDFADSPENEVKRPTRCKTCNLPPDLLAQVNEARARRPKPVSFPIISKWLKSEENIDITQATIRNHFVAGHDQ